MNLLLGLTGTASAILGFAWPISIAEMAVPFLTAVLVISAIARVASSILFAESREKPGLPIAIVTLILGIPLLLYSWPGKSFDADIYHLEMTDQRGRDKGVMVYVHMGVRNLGPPSITSNYRLKVIPPSGTELTARIVHTADLPMFYFKMPGGGNSAIAFAGKDSLYAITQSAIGTGERPYGYLVFFIPRAERSQLAVEGTMFSVQFWDVRKREYEAVYSWGLTNPAPKDLPNIYIEKRLVRKALDARIFSRYDHDPPEKALSIALHTYDLASLNPAYQVGVVCRVGDPAVDFLNSSFLKSELFDLGGIIEFKLKASGAFSNRLCALGAFECQAFLQSRIFKKEDYFLNQRVRREIDAETACRN